jgi:hypothetical protein
MCIRPALATQNARHGMGVRFSSREQKSGQMRAENSDSKKILQINKNISVFILL